MEYSINHLPKSKIEITFSLSSEELEGYRGKALEELRSHVQVEGFRKGAVPAELAQQRLGEETVLSEAARKAVEESYGSVVEQEGLDVIGTPEVAVQKLAPGNPFEFQISVATVPAVDLPDYKKVAQQAERKPVSVEEKEIESTLQYIKESRKQEDGTIPELTDEFVQTLGEFTSVDQLKESIKNGLQQEKEMQERERFRQDVLEKIAEKAKIEVPDVLIEQEKHAMLENIKQGVAQTLQMSFEEYLQKVNKSEEELVNEFTEDATKRVRNSLVLREITKQENIEPTQEEVQEEVNKILSRAPDPEAARREINEDRLMQYVKGMLENEKTLQLLEELVK